MSEAAENQEARGAERRQQSRRAPLLVGAAMVALALGGLWLMRAPVAENLISRELAARNIRMSYHIASIGPRTQRIEHIVLGDPRHPDMTARWVEVDIGIAGFAPTVAAVRASGVRLYGSYEGGRLSLGELDKFLGQGGTADTALPDIRIGLSDARASIRTDYGPLGMDLSGHGNLRDGFRGQAVVAMPAVKAGDCAAEKALANIAISMRDGAPRLRGPVKARAVGCPQQGLAMAAPLIDLDARIEKSLKGADVSAVLTAQALRASGMTLGDVRGAVDVKAGKAGFEGKGRVAGASLSSSTLLAGRSELMMRFKGVMPTGRPVRAGMDGTLALRDVASRARDPLAALSPSVAGTPLAPLLAKLNQAVREAGKGNSFTTRLAARNGLASLSDLHFSSASGARMDMQAGSRALLNWADGSWGFEGNMAMGGGGLPQASLAMNKSTGGGLSGRLDLRPYAAGNARLAMAPVQFRGRGGKVTGFATHVTLDGPLSDGAVKGVSLPVSGALGAGGSMTFNSGCTPLQWQALRISTLSLDPAKLLLCPEEGGAMLQAGHGRMIGGARVRNVALTGRIGSSPLGLRAADLAFTLSRQGFRGTGVEARIGQGDAPVSLGAASLDGLFARGGFAGRFGGGYGRIGSVPLNLTDMDGRWRFAGGRLDVDGALRVSDTAATARFSPVVSRDAHLTLVNGRIAANGRLQHPVQGGSFARVEIRHGLSTGEGDARFALENLRFGSALQPDDLTPLALGVVANVNGAVTGHGEIRWTSDRVDSKGHFETEGMNLAAAFGPVQGLTTRLDFTDLLGMETAPGQVAHLKSVNPGVEVVDGTVRFQLVKGSRARIEDGEWPFAGGRLSLLPSTMDFDEKGARNLIFRVTGLDAGAFINTMELKNISATGTYDGLLPMVFDASGGRIVGGILVARQEGMPPLLVESAQNLTVPCDPERQAGTLSYVGEVSNADMGTYGKLAFDALKRLRYKCLTILLDGAVDGEFVTRIAINGVNQGSDDSRKSAIMRNFLGIPFIFNVRIEAPFRGLLNTYQSFVDPTALVRGSLGPQYQTVLENKLAVQPSESDNGASREGE